MLNNFYKNIRISLYCKYLILILLTFLTLGYNAYSLANSKTINIVTQNAYNFFNDVDDHKKEKILKTKNYQKRIQRLAQHLIENLHQPNIIALQEVENYKTLHDLKAYIQSHYHVCYTVILLEGHKKIAINVGYLIDCRFKLKNISQLFKGDTLAKYHRSLFTRPPLYINICWFQQCYHLINVHLRSMLGLKNNKKSKYVSYKRLKQAEALATWIHSFLTRWPKQYLIVLGDFNALKGSNLKVDVLNTIKTGLANKSLFDVGSKVPKHKRFSYIYKHKKQVLDYMLISQNFVSKLQSVRYYPIDYKVSDHAALGALFSP